MHFDLNVPIVPSAIIAGLPFEHQSKKKPKQPRGPSNVSEAPLPVLSTSEKKGIDAHIDYLTQLGYGVIALNQTVFSKYDPAINQNYLIEIEDRPGVIILRRLTIVLDERSESGFGLTNNNAVPLSSYDIISVCPTTASTFSLACLSHSVASALTAHIISLELSSQPRLPFFLKNSLVKTAIKNGAVFEICYGPAVSSGVEDSHRRNWWANAREVVRATGGKGALMSGGGTGSEIRGPKDVINLAIILGMKQDQALHTLTTLPKSVTIRAQTRKTYRAVLSEPKLIKPLSTLNTFIASEERNRGSYQDAASDHGEVAITMEHAGQVSQSQEATTSTAGPDTKKRRHLDEEFALNSSALPLNKRKRKSRQ